MKRYSYCKFTIEEEQQIIEDYVNGVGGGTVLGRKYGCSPDTITNILKAYNIPRRSLREARNLKRTLNEEAFTEDSPESAYWLGWMYTDGYISTTNKYTSYFGLTLATIDIQILEDFKKYLDFNGEIATYTSSSGYGKGNQYSRLLVGSNKIVKTLKKLGVVENKTFKINSIPPVKHKDDFIRGVIDGDGSIRADNSHLRIHGNLEFLTAVAEYIGEEYKISSDKSIYTLSYSLPISRKLLKRFYKDSKIHLQRKYNLAKKHFCPIT